MSFFNLPNQTIVNKSIPKNAFDSYTNSKQKKLFTDIVERIKWTNKLSKDTINLKGKEIQEIQVFHITLRKNENVQKILDIIDKSIPYHIIFMLSFNNEVMISVSQKHLHPTNENNTVIDWTFKTEWLKKENLTYELNLKNSLDDIIKDFCIQLSTKKEGKGLSIDKIVENEAQIEKLKKEIDSLQKKIKSMKQFNRKLELNIQLKEKQNELNSVMKS